MTSPDRCLRLRPWWWRSAPCHCQQPRRCSQDSTAVERRHSILGNVGKLSIHVSCLDILLLRSIESTPNEIRSLNILLYKNFSRNFYSCQFCMIHCPCVGHRNTISTLAKVQWKFEVFQWQIGMQRTILITNI